MSRLSAETVIPVRPVEERHAPQNDNDPEEGVDVADAGDTACSECVDEEEGRVPKWRKSPKQPTKKEIEEHEATDIPFRSWCRLVGEEELGITSTAILPQMVKKNVVEYRGSHSITSS